MPGCDLPGCDLPGCDLPGCCCPRWPPFSRMFSSAWSRMFLALSWNWSFIPMWVHSREGEGWGPSVGPRPDSHGRTRHACRSVTVRSPRRFVDLPARADEPVRIPWYAVRRRQRRRDDRSEPGDLHRQPRLSVSTVRSLTVLTLRSTANAS
ncbi:hypothetical protein ACWEKM_26630 [Streptomyces sp. NPDC004752]